MVLRVPVTHGTRTCPTCGEPEKRWTVANVDYVNLSPFTDNCVGCLIALTKETAKPAPPPPPWRGR